MKSTIPAGPTPDELLAGGKTLTVRIIDRAAAVARDEEVFIRLVPMKEYPAMRAELTNMGALIERFTSQPEGWAETVGPVSRGVVLKEGERINADFFEHWLPWMRERMEKFKTVEGEFLEEAAKALVAEFLKTKPSGTSVSAAPPAGAAPSARSGL